MATARKAVSGFAAQKRSATGLAADFADLLRTLKTLFDPYRPELHYMRGPGPKCRAKQTQAATTTAAAPALVPAKA